jgi:bacillopeptidase F (M6 metalloprotease family)
MVSDARVTDARLTMAGAAPLSPQGMLSFWHWFDMEATGITAWDGGVVEISADGGAWQDLGPYITSGGYAHQVPPGPNPLQNRPAWSGSSGGWQQVTVDLSAFAGSSVRIRFRWAGDYSNYRTVEGWYVDDIHLTSVWPPFTHRLYFSSVYKAHR